LLHMYTRAPLAPPPGFTLHGGHEPHHPPSELADT
jgi:hypothetical protein